ncbi:MAG: preprotein translocase subunit YajC [Pseudobdellovibrionaceae bacterium]
MSKLSIILISIFSTVSVFAQTPAGAPGQPSSIEMFLPFIFMIGIFYFLVIRPQGKRQKTHAKFLDELKRGDSVITTTGIFGKIEGLAEKVATLEIADGVRIKILKTQIASSQAVFEKEATTKKEMTPKKA